VVQVLAVVAEEERRRKGREGRRYVGQGGRARVMVAHMWWLGKRFSELSEHGRADGR